MRPASGTGAPVAGAGCGQHGSPRSGMTGGAGSTLCWGREPPKVAPTPGRGPDRLRGLRGGPGSARPRSGPGIAGYADDARRRHRTPLRTRPRRDCAGPARRASWPGRSWSPSARSPTRAPRRAALAAAGRLQQLAYRVLGTRPAWDRKVLRGVPEPAGAGGDRERRVAAGVPLHARRPQPHPAGLADRPARTRARPAPLLPRGRARVRRRLGVPRRDQPRRDRHGPDPRHLGRRGAGADAVHPVHVGALGPGRHQLTARRDPGRRALPGGQRLHPTAAASPARCGATTTTRRTSAA